MLCVCFTMIKYLVKDGFRLKKVATRPLPPPKNKQINKRWYLVSIVYIHSRRLPNKVSQLPFQCAWLSEAFNFHAVVDAKRTWVKKKAVI